MRAVRTSEDTGKAWHGGVEGVGAAAVAWGRGVRHQIRNIQAVTTYTLLISHKIHHLLPPQLTYHLKGKKCTRTCMKEGEVPEAMPQTG